MAISPRCSTRRVIAARSLWRGSRGDRHRAMQRASGHARVGTIYRFGASRPSRIGRVKSRAHAMKRSATGLSVRFFSVTMLTGHGRAGKSTGNTLRDLKYATDLGIAVMNWPSARKWVMTDIDSVTRLALGIARLRAWQASARFR